jgi:hypothetical protein
LRLAYPDLTNRETLSVKDGIVMASIDVPMVQDGGTPRLPELPELPDGYEDGLKGGQ